MSSFMIRVRNILSQITLTYREMSVFFFKKDFKTRNFGNVVISSASFREINEIEKIYFRLNKKKFKFFQRLSLYFNSRKRLLIARSTDTPSCIVALNFYYLNQRDLFEKTVHEGFIGVLEKYQGQGIASKLRKLAVDHFSSNGFDGISTRISETNLGSLKSARNLGFEIEERYFDQKLAEIRFYMVCRFRKSREK